MIYLAFGADYPSSIAKYFIDIWRRESFDDHIPRVLMQSNKISSVLKKMIEDNLVTLQKQVKVRAAPRSYYVINPKIIQTPFRDKTTYLTENGSPLIIPPEPIDAFLGWLALKQAGAIDKSRREQLDEQLRLERHERADEILEELIPSKRKVNFFTFMSVIRYEAMKWDSLMGSSNQPSALNKLIDDYIHEFNPYTDRDVAYMQAEQKLEYYGTRWL